MESSYSPAPPSTSSATTPLRNLNRFNRPWPSNHSLVECSSIWLTIYLCRTCLSLGQEFLILCRDICLGNTLGSSSTLLTNPRLINQAPWQLILKLPIIKVIEAYDRQIHKIPPTWPGMRHGDSGRICSILIVQRSYAWKPNNVVSITLPFVQWR